MDRPPTVDTAGPHARETEITRRRYDRIAPVYDAIEWVMELRVRRWRRALWERVEGRKLIELGVGTGKNLPYHPAGVQVTAVDLSPKMLERARRRAERLGSTVELELADVQQLPYPDGTFDVAVATFLFCSVPDPVLGLREARRVLKPGGKLFLMEHVLSEIPVLRGLMRFFDPIPVRVWGAHIDRETVGNVERAGFRHIRTTNLSLDVVKRIEAVA